LLRILRNYFKSREQGAEHREVIMTYFKKEIEKKNGKYIAAGTSGSVY